MPALIPGFDYDVFVSYAHVDNLTLVPGDTSSGWVHTLVDNLKALLSQKLGRKEWGKIWLDRRLPGNEDFPPEIQDGIKSSATLLVIFSEGYLQSDWCRQERELFLQAAQQNAGDQGRIFLVHQTEIDQNRRPAPFRNLLGYSFYKKDNEDAPPRTLGIPVVDPSDRDYFRRLDDLSRELADCLLQMKKAAKTEVEMPPPQGSEVTIVEPPQPKGSAITVFLAESTVDLEDHRDNIKRQLEQVGLRILPETYYDRAPSTFKRAMEKDLAESILFVQLLGRYTSPKTSDLPKGYEGLQLDLVKAAEKPLMRWHDPDLDVKDCKDPDLITSEAVMVMAFEDFKQEVEKQARLHASQRISKSIIDGAFALIDANTLDLPAADNIRMVLDQHNIGFDIVDENTPLVDLVMEDEYDALIVVYGQCSQAWVQQQVRECRKVLMRKKTQSPVCAVYLGPPTSKEPLRIKPPKFFYFNDPDEQSFSEFIEAIKTKVAVSSE